MDVPPNKTALLARVRSAYIDLETLLTQMAEPECLSGGVTGSWSVKDLVAHITFWQTFLERQIKGVLRNEAVPHLPSESQSDTDRINLQAVAASAQRSWHEARAPLWECIAGETYEHYATHANHIRRWMQSLPPP